MAETSLCECGCGQPAPISPYTSRPRGYVKGQPRRFIQGHGARKHGHGSRGNHSPTFRTWRGMIQRCTNPNAANHARYAHVAVCDRWRSFENFLADMGERPDGKTLDRIDPHGNYEPSNCRWATPAEQRRNRRDT